MDGIAAVDIDRSFRYVRFGSRAEAAIVDALISAVWALCGSFCAPTARTRYSIRVVVQCNHNVKRAAPIMYRRSARADCKALCDI